MNKWFYLFTSRQRGGMLLIVGCICGVLLLKITQRWDKGSDLSVDSTAVLPSSSTARYPFPATESAPSLQQEKGLTIRPFAFDPNRADSSTLSSLGLPTKVVRNVLKYRQKGGNFRSAQDFKKIYGLSQDCFEKLSPYIVIGSSSTVDTSPKDRLPTGKDSIFSFKFKELTLVDLNKADTSVLKKIPGIGSGIAKAIVAYRERLGGYLSEEQVLEIEWVRKYLRPDILKWFVVEACPPIQKLPINRCSLERLRAHPYLNFYQAKAIIEIRYKKDKINSIAELVLLDEFSSDDIRKLTPYLSFE